MPAPAPKPPFGLSSVPPAFDRATRLAKALFDAADSFIVLVENGRVWRSNDPRGRLPQSAPGAEYVMRTGELLWLEDAALDARFKANKIVAGDFKTRFYAAAPVRLRDGSTPGALAVSAGEPRPFDKALAKCLMDLADGVADECDRARAAAELAETRAIVDALVDGAPISWALTDREFRIVKASPGWLEAVGSDRDRSTGRSPFDLAPEQYGPLRDRFEACLAGRAAPSARLRMERDGQVQWLQCEFTPWRNRIGEAAGVIVTTHDVTELMLAVTRSERSEERLQLALELADIYVEDVDLAGRTVELAGAVDTFFERPNSFESWAKDPLAIVDPRDRSMVMDAWRRNVVDGTPYRPEYRVRRSDGTELWSTVTTRLFKNEAGQVTRVVAAGQNITDRKQAELVLMQARDDAEAANRAKTTFLATMSHEIRTPLNGVLGMAHAMGADALTPVQRERLAVIHQSGEALLAILDDVLDLAKIEAGKIELEEIDFDLGQMLRGAHAAYSTLAGAKGVALVFDLDTAQGFCRGDPTRLRQILYNLISNALKFTAEGEIRVTGRWDGDSLRLAVADTGIGIASDHLPHLFERFAQADASTTRSFGGTGLGLAICRQLAEMMGGAIEVESLVGVGSTFTLRVPLLRAGDAPASAAASLPLAPADGEPLGLRVLAAEDNRINQLVLKTLLSQVAVETVFVDNGAQAVEAWSREPWDAILMDVQMPVMDGLAATKLIREREAAEGRPRTPIIALTANALAHQIAEYRTSGMDGHVSKPIQVKSLLEALQAATDPAEDPVSGKAQA